MKMKVLEDKCAFPSSYLYLGVTYSCIHTVYNEGRLSRKKEVRFYSHLILKVILSYFLFAL